MGFWGAHGQEGRTQNSGIVYLFCFLFEDFIVVIVVTAATAA
jgi:hypothetical protein